MATIDLQKKSVKIVLEKKCLTKVRARVGDSQSGRNETAGSTRASKEKARLFRKDWPLGGI